MSNALAIGSAATAAATQIDATALAALGRTVSLLTCQAAQALGASAEIAERIGAQRRLVVDGMGVAISPLLSDATGRRGLLVTVDTGRPLANEDGASAALQHTPALLVSFSAALGNGDRGQWTLMRRLALDATLPQMLAQHIVVTRQLVDVVWSRALH